uniref:Uncharacterized protein n=1 Tax=Noctiluca scintillans TaxID=2966 RepID=A0A7S0ZXI1_NOCSC|mmetsp:Transcript_22814/g.60102  ORF Transcript_22814/g.60102 Transcript_22814/m.60102 type:complete len:155 (+) Transcript_22814:11-475(+)
MRCLTFSSGFSLDVALSVSAKTFQRETLVGRCAQYQCRFFSRSPVGSLQLCQTFGVVDQGARQTELEYNSYTPLMQTKKVKTQTQTSTDSQGTCSHVACGTFLSGSPEDKSSWRLDPRWLSYCQAQVSRDVWLFDVADAITLQQRSFIATPDDC